MQKRIFIIGMPGVGKTTLGKQLATELQLPFVDLDSYIEETQGQTIAEIFKEGGENAFRNIEAHALRSYSRLNTSFIMACGGGTPYYNSNIDYMNQHGLTVYYTKPIEIIISQLENDTIERPLLTNTKSANLLETLNKTLNKREPYYLKANIISDNFQSIYKAINSIELQAG
ncbi:MAG: shikimate kinase [Sphingobacteriales bacterium JAD_PAG50586_3]|nr:MAG: shikimate kinase [Sphingobacteriales bacterium JAD_PAG50586_3]